MSFTGDTTVSLCYGLKRITRSMYHGMLVRMEMHGQRIGVTPDQEFGFIGKAWINPPMLTKGDRLVQLPAPDRIVHMPCWGHGYSLGTFDRLWRGLLHHEDNLTRTNGKEYIDVSPQVLEMMKSSFFDEDAHLRGKGLLPPRVSDSCMIEYVGHVFSIENDFGCYGVTADYIKAR